MVRPVVELAKYMIARPDPRVLCTSFTAIARGTLLCLSLLQFEFVATAADIAGVGSSQTSNCASMIWPDGHETRIRNYSDITDFLSACEGKPGSCKFDGKAFPPPLKEGQNLGSRILADALVICTLGPLPELDKSPPSGRFDTLTADKSDDALRRRINDPSKAPPVFSAQATGKLSAGRLREMDVEFFNEFWVKNETPIEERVRKIHALAEQGFEVAQLAEKLYNFSNYGVPALHSNYLVYWQRLKALAELGNPSAQCLFSSTAVEYRSYKQDPPTQYDEEVLAPYYRKAAAAQGHPYCLALWANNAYRDDPTKETKIELWCAEVGINMCQRNIAIGYFNGHGVPMDMAKGVCWLVKAKNQNHARSIASMFDFYSGQLQQKIGKKRLADLLQKWGARPNCNYVSID